MSITSSDPSLWTGSYLHQLEEATRSMINGDDVDMEAEEAAFIARHEEIENVDRVIEIGPSKYLALDTNVLIHHLDALQSLYTILTRLESGLVSLLVPTVVINELDNLSQRDAESDLDTRARTATAWLLRINREKRSSGRGAIRCQRWSERHDTDRRKGDDRVLDCCLYFTEQGGEVVLWSNDRNLALLAETNDIVTISPSRPTATSVILTAFPSVVIDTEHEHMSQPIAAGIEEDAMEIEAEFTQAQTPSPVRSLRPLMSTLRQTPMTISTPVRRSARSSPTKSSPTKSPPSSSSPTRPDVLAALDDIFRQIMTQVPDNGFAPRTPLTSTNDILRHLIDRLNACEVIIHNDLRPELYRAIAGLMTILDYIDPPKGKTAPLRYEVKTALTRIDEALVALNVRVQGVGAIGKML